MSSIKIQLIDIIRESLTPEFLEKNKFIANSNVRGLSVEDGGIRLLQRDGESQSESRTIIEIKQPELNKNIDVVTMLMNKVILDVLDKYFPEQDPTRVIFNNMKELGIVHFSLTEMMLDVVYREFSNDPENKNSFVKKRFCVSVKLIDKEGA